MIINRIIYFNSLFLRDIIPSPWFYHWSQPLRRLDNRRSWEASTVIPHEKQHTATAAWFKANMLLRPETIRCLISSSEACNYFTKGCHVPFFPGKIKTTHSHLEQLRAQRMIHSNSLKRLLGKWESLNNATKKIITRQIYEDIYIYNYTVY